MILGMQQQLPLQIAHGHHCVTQQPAPLALPSLNTQMPCGNTGSSSGIGPGLPLAAKHECERPKLSLNTTMTLSHSRSFGKGSTSLRLDTLSTVSPTMRNTFSNAYEQQQRPLSLPSSSLGTPVEQSQRRMLLKLDVASCMSSSTAATTSDVFTAKSQPEISQSEESRDSDESSKSGSTSGSSSPTISPDSVSIPYSLPTHHQSILINSIIPKTDATARIRRAPKPLFPAPKRVSFKEPLAEDIQTCRYIHAHYDLVRLLKEEEEMAVQKRLLEEEADKDGGVVLPVLHLNTLTLPNKVDAGKTYHMPPSPTRLRFAEFKFPIPPQEEFSPPSIDDISPILFSSPQSSSALSTPTSSSPTTASIYSYPGAAVHHSHTTSLDHLPQRMVHHQRHLKRDSSSSNSPSSPVSVENDSDDSCTHTPVAGRNKKRRMWVWTLGPLEGYSGPVEAASADSNTSVEHSIAHIPEEQETSKIICVTENILDVMVGDNNDIEGVAILM
jgi:hypothetical protein